MAAEAGDREEAAHAVSKRAERVNRPLKKAEFEIRFATRNAEQGWIDLLATTRNAVVEAREFLTRTPMALTERNHPMRADLEFIQRGGDKYPRWQHELPGGARIWFYVDEGVVWLVDVHTRHPNQTK